jgi:uroporphyrin-III C-methyltransferase/precorrin-2 dehydrogenase/sirohydrochlorin ferrochelatase
MYFPVMLRLEDEPCLLVGGGAAALQKLRALRKAGARVTVVAPRIAPPVARLAATCLRRAFRASDVRNRAVVVAATDDPAVNRRIHAACRARRVPVNVVDVPDLCTFIVPSVLRRGPVTVAVSTGGASPSLARALRRRLEALLPRSLGTLARDLARERRAAKSGLPPGPVRMRLLRRLARERLRKESLA